MKDNLIFIPFQDSCDYLASGILTREYAILYMLMNLGFKKMVNVIKPRTYLDKKMYVVKEENFPTESIERYVKNKIITAKSIQYLPPLSLGQILKKRGWWEDAYIKNYKKISKSVDVSNSIVYSNNPYAWKLLKKLKENGAIIVFDSMDNFCKHPSFNTFEKNIAFKSYREICKFTDYYCANSQETCRFIFKHFGRKPELIKNGVFKQSKKIKFNDKQPEQYDKLINEKQGYKSTVGYIGKIGKRLDENLIKEIATNCKECLFVFIGPILKDQKNRGFYDIATNNRNVLFLDALPSAYVPIFLDAFDILMIPHAVGSNENGGDPLKLYQYLATQKPVITTNIIGVDEFKDIITISNVASEWVDFVKKHSTKQSQVYDIPSSICWDIRAENLIDFAKNN